VRTPAPTPSPSPSFRPQSPPSQLAGGNPTGIRRGGVADRIKQFERGGGN
jgi:hypothetical protein